MRTRTDSASQSYLTNICKICALCILFTQQTEVKYFRVVDGSPSPSLGYYKVDWRRNNYLEVPTSYSYLQYVVHHQAVEVEVVQVVKIIRSFIR